MSTDWLDKIDTPQATIASLAEYAKKITVLQTKVAEAEEALAKVKAELDNTQKAACAVMLDNGVSSISTEDGAVTYTVVTKTSCSVAKNARRSVCEWLERIGAGSMVSHKIETMPEALPLLQENHITYADIKDVNTSTLKAWLNSQLGMKGETPKMSLADIPEGCSFFAWNELQTKGGK